MAINGFSTCNPSRVGRYRVPGTNIVLAVRREIAPLLIGYAAEYHDLVEPIDKGVMDCWGYACRRIRGASTMSKHSGGLAVDLNATKYPLGVRDRHTARQKATIRALCRKYGLTYGGDWQRRPDAMHAEIAENRSNALERVRRLQSTPKTAAARRRAVPRLAKLIPRAKNSDVVLLQKRLNELGWNLNTDGIYGRATQDAVAAFQRRQGWSGSGADGAVGPLTLRRLF